TWSRERLQTGSAENRAFTSFDCVISLCGRCASWACPAATGRASTNRETGEGISLCLLAAGWAISFAFYSGSQRFSSLAEEGRITSYSFSRLAAYRSDDLTHKWGESQGGE